MHIRFFDSKEEVSLQRQTAKHQPPHVHMDLEVLYVPDGNIVLGVGEELYDFPAGSAALIFPHVIHHCQVFSEGKNRLISMLAASTVFGTYEETLSHMCPENPVIAPEHVHPDIIYAIQALMQDPAEEEVHTINLSFTQLILARALPRLKLIDKTTVGSDDIVYRTVAYILDHYLEPLSLESIGRALGYSPYAISRVFSRTFHMNFNRFVNEKRLNHAVSLMQYDGHTLTDICYESGFDSQRTFNRVFKEHFHMTPREYRKLIRQEEKPSELS